MKTSGEDKFTDLDELNIVIIGETGFPHLDIFTKTPTKVDPIFLTFQELASQPG